MSYTPQDRAFKVRIHLISPISLICSLTPASLPYQYLQGGVEIEGSSGADGLPEPAGDEAGGNQR